VFNNPTARRKRKRSRQNQIVMNALITFAMQVRREQKLRH
jgi:hypothetical protein